MLRRLGLSKKFFAPQAIARDTTFRRRAALTCVPRTQ